ncbi:MAG: 2-hydroxy-6-oxonona-2,4-dienedioate hydrolase, partial [Candidatus Arcticimaribacter sp.]
MKAKNTLSTRLSMEKIYKEEKDFKFVEIGEGQPIIILHGLMGGLSNFT